MLVVRPVGGSANNAVIAGAVRQVIQETVLIEMNAEAAGQLNTLALMEVKHVVHARLPLVMQIVQVEENVRPDIVIRANVGIPLAHLKPTVYVFPPLQPKPPVLLQLPSPPEHPLPLLVLHFKSQS